MFSGRMAISIASPGAVPGGMGRSSRRPEAASTVPLPFAAATTLPGTRFTRPMKSATTRLAAGDLQARSGLPADRTEFGQLASTFDTMAAALEQAREAVLNLTHPSPDDPVLVALADVERTFPVPMAAFGELIDGCVADVRGTRSQTFDHLHTSCRGLLSDLKRKTVEPIALASGCAPPRW